MRDKASESVCALELQMVELLVLELLSTDDELSRVLD